MEKEKITNKIEIKNKFPKKNLCLIHKKFCLQKKQKVNFKAFLQISFPRGKEKKFPKIPTQEEENKEVKKEDLQ